jgi:hypothetical protein
VSIWVNWIAPLVLCEIALQWRKTGPLEAPARCLRTPDPFRVKYRETLNEAVGMVVRDRKDMDEALAILGLPEEDALKFQQLLVRELAALEIFNCARYRLGIKQTQAWIDEGRPR